MTDDRKDYCLSREQAVLAERYFSTEKGQLPDEISLRLGRFVLNRSALHGWRLFVHTLLVHYDLPEDVTRTDDGCIGSVSRVWIAACDLMGEHDALYIAIHTYGGDSCVLLPIF